MSVLFEPADIGAGAGSGVGATGGTLFVSGGIYLLIRTNIVIISSNIAVVMDSGDNDGDAFMIMNRTEMASLGGNQRHLHTRSEQLIEEIEPT
jgi:hypothetical protein